MNFRTASCTRCKDDTRQELICFLLSGMEKFGWRCQKCKLWAGEWVKKVVLQAEGIVLETVRKETQSRAERCFVCYAEAAELHHFGPKHIFGVDQAERWPKHWLCLCCHNEWHNKMTPHMSEYKTVHAEGVGAAGRQARLSLGLPSGFVVEVSVRGPQANTATWVVT